jgi:hypothetical protein
MFFFKINLGDNCKCKIHSFLDKRLFDAASLRQGAGRGFKPLLALSSPSVGSHWGFKPSRKIHSFDVTL